MSKEKTLFKKLLDVWQEMPGYVRKEGYNSFHKYKYNSEAQIKEIFMPLLRKAGILFTCGILSQDTEAIEGQIFTKISVKYRFIDTESGEILEDIFQGQGSDKGDKGLYKAITGAIKFIFSSNFLMVTGDDPEKEDEELEKMKEKAKVLFQELKIKNPDKVKEFSSLVPQFSSPGNGNPKQYYEKAISMLQDFLKGEVPAAEKTS